MKKILGDITVRDNGNGYTARHAGKTATCTSGKEGAMDAVLKKVYGPGKTFFYRFQTFCWKKGASADIYNAVSVEEEA